MPTSMQFDNMPHPMLEDYESSPHIINDSEEDYITEEDLSLPEPAPSGRSSISSFPASIIHHDIDPDHTFPPDGLHTPLRSRAATPTSHIRNIRPVSPLPNHNHLTGFRNPSSVRALQMRDECSDGEDSAPGHVRRGSRLSYVSYRSNSTHSTPGKRISRSLTGSPVKNSSKLRKEFPLVLLHCTLIPSIISPKANSVSKELLEAIVPEPYKRRWKLLQDRVVKNLEVRDRGVLIPHPKDDYDMLEERLLESLELEKSVVSNGHFVGRSESRASTADSGFGSEEHSNRSDATDEEEEGEGEEGRCVDCGGHLCGDKRWEVKVFAANGLMRAGAWSAAWYEMEKVDVQVSVWMPEDVKQEVEARLDAVIAQEKQLQEEEVDGKGNMNDDARTREIYGESQKSRKLEESDGPDLKIQQLQESQQQAECKRGGESLYGFMGTRFNKMGWRDTLSNHIQLLTQDRKNVAIILLTLLVLFCSMNVQQASVQNQNFPELAIKSIQETQTEYLTTTVLSTRLPIVSETSTVAERAHVTTATTSGLIEENSFNQGTATNSFGLSATTIEPETESIASESVTASPEHLRETIEVGTAFVDVSTVGEALASMNTLLTSTSKIVAISTSPQI